MKKIRLVTESGKHIYDVELQDEFLAIPGNRIFHDSDIWKILYADAYTSEDPKGPKVEYVVI